MRRAADGSLNPGCTDKRGHATWSCVEWDGTGLWCDSCLAVANENSAAVHNPTPSLSALDGSTPSPTSESVNP